MSKGSWVITFYQNLKSEFYLSKIGQKPKITVITPKTKVYFHYLPFLNQNRNFAQISKNWKFWNMLKLGQKWVQMVNCMLTKWFLTIWHPFLAKKLKKLKILIFALKHRFWNCVFARSLVTRNWAHLVLNTSKVNC